MNKIKLGKYRARYQKNLFIEVTKVSKYSVYFNSENIRIVYPIEKFLLDFIKDKK